MWNSSQLLPSAAQWESYSGGVWGTVRLDSEHLPRLESHATGQT